ncbi:Heme oxygenase HutZ [Methylophilaceae bacterium]|nr:Heme oxygenase HutZ [Methylophilaceae bacterium]
MSLTSEARQFLRSTQNGILSTASVKFEGYPFGSVAPFVLDHDGQPLILISTIAEHTRNIIANCKVSLLVFAGAEDLHANARLTLLGDAEQTDKNDELLKARYLRYFPSSGQYFEMHDFYFYRIQIRHARYIAGFGNMGWLQGKEFKSPRTPLAAQEAEILEHMNADHAENMIAYCRHFHGISPGSITMLGIDSDGFDVRADGRILRFNFDQPIEDALSARTALVAMAKACRA